MHSCSYNRCTLHRWWWWWVLQRLLKRMGTSTRRRKFWDRFVGQRVNYTWLVKGAVSRLLRMLAFDRCKLCKQGHVYMSPCEKPTRAVKPSSTFFIFVETFCRNEPFLTAVLNNINQSHTTDTRGDLQFNIGPDHTSERTVKLTLVRPRKEWKNRATCSLCSHL